MELQRICGDAIREQRLTRERMREILCDLCKKKSWTAVELGQFLNRKPTSLRNKHLTPMVREGLLSLKYPDEPNRPDQAYTKAETADDSGW